MPRVGLTPAGSSSPRSAGGPRCAGWPSSRRGDSAVSTASSSLAVRRRFRRSSASLGLVGQVVEDVVQRIVGVAGQAERRGPAGRRRSCPCRPAPRRRAARRCRRRGGARAARRRSPASPRRRRRRAGPAGTSSMISARPGARRTMSPLRGATACGHLQVAWRRRRAPAGGGARRGSARRSAAAPSGTSRPARRGTGGRRRGCPDGRARCRGARRGRRACSAGCGSAISLPGITREEKMQWSPCAQVDVRVGALGDARQGRARLALAAGAEVEDLVVAGSAGLVVVDEGLDALHQADRLGRRGHPVHRAADQADAPAVGLGGADHGVHPRHVGGEAGHRDLALQRRRSAGSARRAPRPPSPPGRRRRRWWNRRPWPARPRRPAGGWRRCRSAPPSSGSGSIFQSPVCRIVPSGVRIARPLGSGIEWVSVIRSSSNGPELDRAAQRHLGDRRPRPAGPPRAASRAAGRR